MATRYAVKRVFLATDDTETVSNITAYCGQHGIQVGRWGGKKKII